MLPTSVYHRLLYWVVAYSNYCAPFPASAARCKAVSPHSFLSFSLALHAFDCSSRLTTSTLPSLTEENRSKVVMALIYSSTKMLWQLPSYNSTKCPHTILIPSLSCKIRTDIQSLRQNEPTQHITVNPGSSPQATPSQRSIRRVKGGAKINAELR